ncbi:nlpC/P60 family protein [[Clostridium] sordellii ATCC 9714]|nr:nlpC/P60 family protein [[Clostridium] sordellii ATCC 9714] [Paeniclostridium sordellii ATCC 9714]
MAYSKLGSPYVWGAEGPNTFDCSGLTSYVFRNAAGVSLPRTSGSQYGVGTSVSKANLQPGDLVFFATGGGGISHVGIYVGGGQMIHAPQTGDVVKVSNINSSYWQNAYVGAKRVL